MIITYRIVLLIITLCMPMKLPAMWCTLGRHIRPLARRFCSENVGLQKDLFEALFADFKAERVKEHHVEKYILHKAFGGDLAYQQQAINAALEMRRRLILQKYGVQSGTIARHVVATMCNGVPNVENQLGGSVYPLCNAGTLTIHGEYAKGTYPLWPTTHESALPAGMKRGVTLLNMVGGVQTVVTHANMTRAPLIETPSIQAAKYVVDSLHNNKELFDFMANIVTVKSTVTKLIGIKALQDGRDVHIRFVFDTGDCMGMNSATLYGGYIVEGLRHYFSDIHLVALSGNTCSDKKQTHANIWEGRGVGVEAEVEIPESHLKEVYKRVSAASVVDINTKKNLRGSALAGTLGGFNANAANAVAAMFLSTGQDAAQLAESAAAFTRAHIARNGNLVLGVKLPCLEIAATGGGVGSETSREYLEVLGCYGPSTNPGYHKKKLGEIIAGAVLAQEFNLLATLANNYELAESHARLSRGRMSNVPEEVSQYILRKMPQRSDKAHA